jgi:hypothetical protein
VSSLPHPVVKLLTILYYALWHFIETLLRFPVRTIIHGGVTLNKPLDKLTGGVNAPPPERKPHQHSAGRRNSSSRRAGRQGRDLQRAHRMGNSSTIILFFFFCRIYYESEILRPRGEKNCHPTSVSWFS